MTEKNISYIDLLFFDMNFKMYWIFVYNSKDFGFNRVLGSDARAFNKLLLML